MAQWEQLRRRMVDRQLRSRGIRDKRVLAAMGQVPRHEFVPPALRKFAYEDEPVSLPHRQSVSQPYMVAVMAEALALTQTDTVLEVGAGSGYAAAVIALLAKRVYAIEWEADLADLARTNLRRTGYDDRITIVHGDGTLGCPAHAPYDAISVAAAASEVPARLLEQMEPKSGRLVMPVGPESSQDLTLVRCSSVGLRSLRITGCRFVPLLGPQGRRDEGDFPSPPRP